MRITTKTGDDGTTGLFYGGRVPKNSTLPRAYGAVDEAQAFVALARAESDDDELTELLGRICKDLYVLMAELATLPDNRDKLEDGTTRVTAEMVDALEAIMDDLAGRFEPPTEFVIPGGAKVPALLDVARTVVRRAERETIGAADEGHVVKYLNRLSDLLWTMARWQEGDSEISKEADGTVSGS
ncbi:MAG: cob(I)yrinic acid a,c-diamide adenosyltransferase [Actinomycetota bacterium]